MVSRSAIDKYKGNLKAIVEQLELCAFECEGGNLEQNIAFIALREMAYDIEEDHVNTIGFEGEGVNW